MAVVVVAEAVKSQPVIVEVEVSQEAVAVTRPEDPEVVVSWQVTKSSSVVVELVQELDEDDFVEVAVELGSPVVVSTEGSLSLFKVTGGKPEKGGTGGQTKTPGPGPKPKSSMPPPPQNGQPHRTGTTVS